MDAPARAHPPSVGRSSSPAPVRGTLIDRTAADHPASFLAAAGVYPSDIAAQLGHADGGALAMRVYVHPLREGLERNAAHLDRVVSGEG